MTDDSARDDSLEATALASSARPTGKPKSNLNLGTIVFGGFSLLSLIVCITKGVVPMYGAEAVAWGAMAWYWHKKSPVSKRANLIVLVLAVAVAAAEGYSYGRYSVGTQSVKSYTYLAQGNLQYRVDSHAGRTDRLTSNGWEPVSFDSLPDEVEAYQVPAMILLSGGHWWTDDICIDTQNNSRFVLQDVTVSITIDPDPNPPLGGYDVKLQKGEVAIAGDKPFIKKGGLLDVGEKSWFCGTPPRELPNGSKWSYSLSSAKGWKR